LIKNNVPEIPDKNLIIEPMGRNTAPCIALSSAFLKKIHSPSETMFVLPSDHIIIEKDIFIASIKTAQKAADDGYLVTFGIKPDYPATGYGYIEAGENINTNIYHISKFKEKPDYKTAQSFLEDGNFYWNSGMFMWNIDSILASFDKLAPDIINPIRKIVEIPANANREEEIEEIYSKVPKLPVDIAIMEKSDKGVVIPVNYHWNDVGSWRAVSELQEKDSNNNTLPKKSVVIQSQDNFVHSDKLVALVDVNGLIVIETDDALLIVDKGSAEKIKDVVENIKNKKWDEYL